MKTWVCRRDITHSIPIASHCTPLFQCFLLLTSNSSACILQQYSLAYSEPCHTSNLKRFSKIVANIEKTPFHLNIYGFFWWFQGGRSKFWLKPKPARFVFSNFKLASAHIFNKISWDFNFCHYICPNFNFNGFWMMDIDFQSQM